MEVFYDLYFVQLQNDTQSCAGEMDVKFQVAKDTLQTMLRSMSSIRDQFSDDVCCIIEIYFSSKMYPKYLSFIFLV